MIDLSGSVASDALRAHPGLGRGPLRWQRPPHRPIMTYLFRRRGASLLDKGAGRCVTAVFTVRPTSASTHPGWRRRRAAAGPRRGWPAPQATTRWGDAARREAWPPSHPALPGRGPLMAGLGHPRPPLKTLQRPERGGEQSRKIDGRNKEKRGRDNTVEREEHNGTHSGHGAEGKTWKWRQ